MGKFAPAYADQAERDHAALRTAVRAGVVEVQLDIELGNGDDLSGRKPMRSMPVLDDRETPAVEVAAAPTGASAGFAHRAGAFLLREFREMLPPTIFFFVGF